VGVAGAGREQDSLLSSPIADTVEQFIPFAIAWIISVVASIVHPGGVMKDIRSLGLPSHQVVVTDIFSYRGVESAIGFAH
jgi:hypothetical protein